MDTGIQKGGGESTRDDAVNIWPTTECGVDRSAILCYTGAVLSEQSEKKILSA